MEVFRIFLIILAIKLSHNHCKSKQMRNDGYYGLRKDLEESMTYRQQKALREKEKEPLWIWQPLDHFNKYNKRKWLMRYYSNLDLWKPGGPIVIFIGGEFNISAAYVYGGITYDIANDFHGAMYATEHRYYGESIPIDDCYKYLNAEQALADLVRFIKTLKKDPDFAKSKVIVIGGSYPGILATRLRQFHPDVVDAAVASSTPLLAKVDFYEFIETVENVFTKHGTPNCINLIRKAFRNYLKCFEDPKCVKGLAIKNNLCGSTNLSKRKNQFTFVAALSYKFDNIAQYGSVEKIKKKCQIIEDSNDIEYICKADLKHEQTNPTATIAGLESESDEDNGDCVSVDFFEMVNSWTEPWTYQTCNEFGFFVTTYSKDQIYGNKMPLKAFLEICSIAFGINDVYERVKRTNKRYGALRPNVTKVLFTNGGLDPWHRLGLTESFNNEIPVIFIPEACHTKDLSTLNANASIALLEARRITKSYLMEWTGISRG